MWMSQTLAQLKGLVTTNFDNRVRGQLLCQSHDLSSLALATLSINLR